MIQKSGIVNCQRVLGWMVQDLQSSTLSLRGAWVFANNRMVTNTIAHVIKITLMAMTAGVKLGGLNKFEVSPAGGSRRALSFEGT